MLQEWVCQHFMRDVDKLRQHLIDSQTISGQAIDRYKDTIRERLMI